MLHEALKRLGKHSLIYALGPAVQKLAGFLLLPLVTAYIGAVGDYGVSEMAAVTLAIGAQLFGINLLHGMTRFHKEYESEAERAKLVTTTLFLLIGSTGIAFVLACLLRESGARVFFGGAQYAPALVVVAGILVLQTIGQVGLRYLQLVERSAAYGVITTLKLVVEVAAKVWFLVPLALGYMGLFYSVLVGEGVVALGMLGWIGWRLGVGFSGAMARRLWRYSAPLFVSGLFMFVLHQADRWFVLTWHGETEVGLYGLCYKLGSAGNAVIFEAFALIWFPFIFGIRDAEQRVLLLRKVATLLGALTCWVSLGLALFAREIVGTMADPKFLEAHRALPLIAAGYVFWALFQIAHTVFYLRERTGLVTLVVGFAALANLGLNGLLVPRWGFQGAAWATLATFALLAIGTWRVAERLLPVHYPAGRIAAGLGLGVALWGIGAGLLPEAGPLAWAGKALLLCAYPILLWCTGYLAREEKDMIKKALPF